MYVHTPKPSGSVTRRRSGFSLVELLVVIAVLAVLGTMLFSVVRRVGVRSSSVTCITNLRNLGVAHALWRQDRGMMYELGVNDINKRPSELFFEKGYITEPKVFICPAAGEAPDDAWIEGKGKSAEYNSVYEKKVLSIAANGMAIYRTYLSGGTNGKYAENFLDFIDNSAVFPLFMDGSNFQVNNNVWKGDRYFRIKRRHDDRANFVFLDGHVESLGTTEIDALHPLGDPKIYY